MTNLGSDNKLDTAALSSRILLAIANGVAKQGVGVLPKDIVDTITSTLGKTIDLSKGIIEGREGIGKEITIAGATGKGSRVKWGKKTGWVFGGFLSVENPGDKMLKEFSGTWRAVDKDGSKIDYTIGGGGLEFQVTASENQYSQESWQLVKCYRGKGFKNMQSLFCQFKGPEHGGIETMEFQKFESRHIGIIRGYEGKENNYKEYNPDIVFEKD